MRFFYEMGLFMNFIPCDLHIHTNCSLDGHETAESMCQGAINNNVKLIAITDHLEIDEFYEEGYDKIVTTSFNSTQNCKDKFADKLKVISGVELAQPFSDRTLSNEILKRLDFDFVMCSVHHPHGHPPDIKEIEYDKLDVYEFMNDYFSELEEIAKWDGCDVLAHITCPMRRIQGFYKIDFDYSKVSDSVDSLFETMIKNDVALEINTSGLRQPIGLTMPDRNLIKRYKDLGGKYITVGSDAHVSADIGKGINHAVGLAKELGFEELTTFQKREKLMIKI